MRSEPNIQLPPPESVFDLTKDVISHGILHLIIPPRDVIVKWCETDVDLFVDNEEKTKFLAVIEDFELGKEGEEGKEEDKEGEEGKEGDTDNNQDENEKIS